jgi:hypothetical protein
MLIGLLVRLGDKGKRPVRDITPGRLRCLLTLYIRRAVYYPS